MKNKETDTTAVMLQSFKKGTEDMREQKTKPQVKREKKQKAKAETTR